MLYMGQPTLYMASSSFPPVASTWARALDSTSPYPPISSGPINRMAAAADTVDHANTGMLLPVAERICCKILGKKNYTQGF